MKKVTSVVLTLLLAGSVSAQTNSQSAAVAKAFDQPMLVGTSYGVSPCTEFVELFDGTAERTHGKEKATQAKLSLFGWFEGYMEGFRLATAYTRPEWIGNLTGLDLTKIVAELKDYCTTHPDWLLLLAAGRVSMQIAQDSTGRYK